jgi:hypothetical protein
VHLAAGGEQHFDEPHGVNGAAGSSDSDNNGVIHGIALRRVTRPVTATVTTFESRQLSTNN